MGVQCAFSFSEDKNGHPAVANCTSYGASLSLRAHTFGWQNGCEIFAGCMFWGYEISIVLCLRSFKFHTREEAIELSPGAIFGDRTQGPQLNCFSDAARPPVFSRSRSLTILLFWTAPIRTAFYRRSPAWQLRDKLQRVGCLPPPPQILFSFGEERPNFNREWGGL